MSEPLPPTSQWTIGRVLERIECTELSVGEKELRPTL